MESRKTSLSVDKAKPTQLEGNHQIMLQKCHPILILNRTLHRLPLILDILDELGMGAPAPGDEALRQGCHKGVRDMVDRLQSTPIRTGHVAGDPPASEVEIATTWLLGERPRRLLPADLHDELSVLIEGLVTRTQEILSGRNETRAE